MPRRSTAPSPGCFKRANPPFRSARPPIFFKQQDSYRRQLTRWNEARLRHALDRLAEAEFRMKQTGLPAETLCREAMFAVAQMARGSARSTAA